MARICEICSKKTISVNNIQSKHSGGWAMRAPKTKKTSLPNLRNALLEDSNNNIYKVKVCMKCYKRVKSNSN